VLAWAQCGAWPVARFAGDIDVRPRIGVAVFGEVMVLAQLGRVALGVHVIPGEIGPGPVKRIRKRYLLDGIQVGCGETELR